MFTDILDSLMTQKGINRMDLSKGSGIPYTTIDGWYKKGCADIRLSTLKKLSSYFKVSLDLLMGEKNPAEKQDLSDEAYSIALCFMRADDDGKRLMKNVADYIDKVNSSLSRPIGGFPEAAGVFADIEAQAREYSQPDIPAVHQK